MEDYTTNANFNLGIYGFVPGLTLNELIDINDHTLNDPPSPNFVNDFDSTDDLLAHMNLDEFDSETDEILESINEDDLKSTQGYESSDIPQQVTFGKYINKRTYTKRP